MKRLITSGALLSACLIPVIGGAQTPGTWVLTPYVGVYLPVNDLARFTPDGGTGAAIAKVRHDNALAMGGTANYWFAERLAVEFGGAYAFSHAKVSGLTDGAGAFNDHAWLMAGTTKLMFALLPPSGGPQLRFGIGPSVIRRGGTAYKPDEGKVTGLTNFGGAASLCTRVPITNSLSVRLRAEDFMYRPNLKFRNASDPGMDMNFNRRFQNDLVFSAGLQIGIGR